jgi:hypothetical protein
LVAVGQIPNFGSSFAAPGRHDESVAVVGTGGIAGLRDGDALRAFVDGKLRQEPAVGKSIIKNDGVAVVVGLARPAEA